MKIGNLEVYGVIYKITNKVNGKVYIGQTTVGFDKRYSGGVENKTHNIHLKKSIQKYGIENFYIYKTFDIAFSKEELDIKECLYIKLYNSTNNEYGYNNKDGGSHGKHSLRSRQKMSAIHSGVKLSEQTKLNMSRVRKGKRTGKENPMYGKNPLSNMSNESYNKLMKIKSENMKGDKNPMYQAYGELNPFYGKTHSEETKKILSDKARDRLSKYNPLKGRVCENIRNGKNPNSIFVDVYDENMNFIRRFDSLKECCEWIMSIGLISKYNSAKDAITNSHKKNKIYKGYYFKKINK